MAKKETNQHIAILQDIRNRIFKPVYLLMGDESYYIDLICDAIIENALNENERDFNQTILYGADVDDFAIVVNAAKRFPMMAEHQLIVVKEAQNIRGIDNLSYYLQKYAFWVYLVLEVLGIIVAVHLQGRWGSSCPARRGCRRIRWMENPWPCGLPWTGGRICKLTGTARQTCC